MAEYKWYVLKVLPKTEDKIKKAIEDLQAKKDVRALNRVHIPFKRAYHSQKQKIKKTYFSYIVVEVDMTDNAAKEHLQAIDGILGFVSPTGYSWNIEPNPISQREVDAMLGREEEQKNLLSDIGGVFKENDKVEIMHPLFPGHRGVVKNIDSQNKKIEVEIQMFQKATLVKFDYKDIKKI